MCLYDLDDDDPVGQRRPSGVSIVHRNDIIIVSEVYQSIVKNYN